MTKIKTLLVDDEPGNIIAMVQMLTQYCPNVEIVAQASNISDAAIAIAKHQPQLVLLDIEMPNGNAFDLLNNIAPIHFEVVFVTAYNIYAIQAFKYSAIDYLLKPVNIDELKNAVNKAYSRLEKNSLNLRIDSLLSNINNKEPNHKKIGIPTLDGIEFDEVENIIYLKADNNYTHIACKNKAKIIASKPLKEFEDILPKHIFCRVHNSFIININHIKKYHKGRGGYVIMDDDTNIEVAVRKKDELFKMILH